MARRSYADLNITNGKQDVPYADKHELARGLLRHNAEAITVSGVGAGGAGIDIPGIPFEPASMLISEFTGPLIQKQFAGGPDINMITGAAAAAAVGVTDNGDGTWTLNVPTGVAPDGDTVTIELLGFTDQGDVAL